MPFRGFIDWFTCVQLYSISLKQIRSAPFILVAHHNELSNIAAQGSLKTPPEGRRRKALWNLISASSISQIAFNHLFQNDWFKSHAGSRGGISPLRSHRTVRESLPSHGSSDAVAKAKISFSSMNIPIRLQHYFILMIFLLLVVVKQWNAHQLSPSLPYVSIASSLLRLSPPPLLQAIRTCLHSLFG